MWRRHHGIQKDRDIEIDEPETPGPAASNASTESAAASKGASEERIRWGGGERAPRRTRAAGGAVDHDREGEVGNGCICLVPE